MSDILAEGAPPQAGEVLLTLDNSVAVVLLNLLVGLLDDASTDLPVGLDHPADLGALWSLKSALEQAVGLPLADDYDLLLAQARTQLLARLEAKG